MAIHPGKMLDFMGNEFGQLREYDESREQDWLLLDYPIHEAFANYRRTLNELYRKYDAFWSGEYNPDHFLWLDCDHPELDACAIPVSYTHLTSTTKTWPSQRCISPTKRKSNTPKQNRRRAARTAFMPARRRFFCSVITPMF